MKKFLLLCLLCFSVFVCTGCVKVSYDIEINKNDKVLVSETQAFNFSMFESFDPNIKQKFKEDIDKAKSEFESKGYKTSLYEDETYSGLTISKDNIDFESVSSNLPKGLKNNNKDAFTVEKGFLKDVYKIHLVCNLEDIMSSVSSDDESKAALSQNSSTPESELEEGVVSKTKTTDPETGMVTEVTEYENGSRAVVSYNSGGMQQLGNTVGAMPGVTPVADLTIKIPYPAIKNNASKVISPTEYQWNLVNEDKKVEVILEYEKSKVVSVMLYAVPILFILLLIILFLVFSNKNGNTPKSKKGSVLQGF